MLFAKKKSGSKTTIFDEPEPVFRVVKKADLDQRFKPEVSEDTQALKAAMDQSWDDIISQFNGELTRVYRQELSGNVAIHLILLKFPMPQALRQVLKNAKEPIAGDFLQQTNGLFHQVVNQSYQTSALKPAIAQSDFVLNFFYYQKGIGRDNFEFGIVLEIKKSEDK